MTEPGSHWEFPELPEDPYRLEDPSEIPSPTLLIFREIARRNVARMIELAGDPDRLRPHVKTHKMPDLIRLVESFGIRKHKCATLAEAEMVARAGGRDVLLAYPLVGPNVIRLRRLVDRYPAATFRAIVDEPGPARRLSEAFEGRSNPVPVLVDLDVGMGRTGVAPEKAEALARTVASLPGLKLDGIQAYDGHLRDPDPIARAESARPGVELASKLRDRLESGGLGPLRLVLGGTPTFPAHAAVDLPRVECSPGTSVLHDANYATNFPDLPFQPAALLLTRVVSRPGVGRICLDLGHKAVAADPTGDRVRLLGIEPYTLGPQSEEHLVVETSLAPHLTPGTPILAIPTHVCPTCALHDEALVIEHGRVVDRWPVEARGRALSF